MKIDFEFKGNISHHQLITHINISLHQPDATTSDRQHDKTRLRVPLKLSSVEIETGFQTATPERILTFFRGN